MQDQDQDLLVHQDQDQDQGLAQELPGTFRELPVGSFCCIIGTLGERRANQDKEKLKENKGLWTKLDWERRMGFPVWGKTLNTLIFLFLLYWGLLEELMNPGYPGDRQKDQIEMETKII